MWGKVCEGHPWGDVFLRSLYALALSWLAGYLCGFQPHYLKWQIYSKRRRSVMHLILPGLKFHFIPCLMLFRTVIFLCAQQAIEILIYMSAESQPWTRYLEDGLEGGSHCDLCSLPSSLPCQSAKGGSQPRTVRNSYAAETPCFWARFCSPWLRIPWAHIPFSCSPTQLGKDERKQQDAKSEEAFFPKNQD